MPSDQVPLVSGVRKKGNGGIRGGTSGRKPAICQALPTFRYIGALPVSGLHAIAELPPDRKLPRDSLPHRLLEAVSEAAYGKSGRTQWLHVIPPVLEALPFPLETFPPFPSCPE